MPTPPTLGRPRFSPLLLAGLLAVGGPAAAQAPANTAAPRDVQTNASEAFRQADAQRAFAATQDEGALPPVDAQGRVLGQRVVSLDDDLYILNDVMMQGITAHESMTFTIPERWNLRKDPVVKLSYEHSAVLSPHRSTLTVRVNGSAIASVALNEDNITNGMLEVPIRRDLLKQFNELKLSVVQHIEDECEDPFDPALWTRVSNESQLVFDYYEDPVAADLSTLPGPIFDPLDYGPVVVSLAGSAKASASQLEAVGEIGLTLGRLAAYRGVHFGRPVARASDAPGHVLVVGTPADNPMVGQLLSDLPGAGAGMVAIMPKPGDPTHAALVVTGGDAAGLKKAAEAFASDDRNEILAGGVALIESVESGSPPPTRQQPLPVPVEPEFTLVDLGIGDTTVRGYYAPPIQIPLKLEGDAHVQVDGSKIGIDYAYSAYLDTRLSTLEVRLNGVTLRSIGLDDVDGDERERLWVDLPFDLMEPANEVEVIFHLFPRDFGPCVYITDSHIWGTVYSSTKIEVNRDHYSMLPDLGLLRYDLWPYGEALANEGVVIVTDSAPSSWDATAAAQMASELGRRGVAATPRLQVVPATSGLAERAGMAQIIALVGDGPHAVYDALSSQGKATLPGDVQRKLNGNGDAKMVATVSKNYGTLEQAVLTDAGRTALTVRSGDDTTLPRLVRTLQDEGTLRAFDASLAVVNDGPSDETPPVKNLEITQTQQVGTIPLRSQLQTLLRDSWWALAVAVLIAAFLLAVVVREWAARRGGQA